MAKKKKKQAQKPHREPTRRQLARWQYQRKRQRIIIAAAIAVIAAVIAIVAAGWYIGEYRPLHRTAIRVNDAEFDMEYYVETLEFMDAGQSPQMAQMLADAAIRNIEENELIQQGADELGVSISEEELKERMKEAGVPDKPVNRDVFLTRLLLEKLREEHFGKQVPQTARQWHVMAMLLESEDQAGEVRERLADGESFAELAGELSVERFSSSNEGDYGWHPEEILRRMFPTSPPLEYVLNAEAGSLSQPIHDEEVTKSAGYWLIKVLERDADLEEAGVHAMLLGSEPEARETMARLEEGEEFNALAEELSQLPDARENRGDLGTVTRGEYPPAFDEFVFDEATETGEISGPIRDDTVFTTGGYWLVEVIDVDDDRQISEQDRDLLISRAVDEWVASLRDDPDNEIDHSYLDVEKKMWAIERVTE